MLPMNPDKTLAILREVSLFSALSDTAAEDLLRQCRIRRVKSGTLLFTDTSPADRFYVVLEGQVKVFKLSTRGDQQILHQFGPGNPIGEAAMWKEKRFPANAQTLEDSRILEVPRKSLVRCISQNPDLALGMLAGMSQKLTEFAALIEQLSLRDVPSRLAFALLRSANAAGADTFQLKRTKRDLAAELGTTPESISRALKKLKTLKLISVDGAEISLLDRENLLRMSQGQAPNL